MSKSSRYKRWSDDLRIFGKRVVHEPDDESDAPGKVYYYRSRRARRAQARHDIKGRRWRELTEHERLTQ